MELPACTTRNFYNPTVVKINTADLTLVGLFVAMNDTSTNASIGKPQVTWRKGTGVKLNHFLASLYNPFITINSNIYIDNGTFEHRFHKWSTDLTRHDAFRSHLSNCTNIFIDVNDSIYCSYDQNHTVIKIKFDDSPDESINTTFGNGTNGSTSDLLDSPSGIFVDIHLNLYVADTGNNRIQRFQHGYTNATTVAGNPALGHKGLKSPTGVVVDSDGRLYIADCGNHRIIRSDLNGFRCVVGCRLGTNLGSNQSFHPRALWFDTDGDMFVFDQINHDIQKFSQVKDLLCMFSFSKH